MLIIKARAAIAALSLLSVAGAASAATVNIGFDRVEPHNSFFNPAGQFNCALSDVAGHPDQVTFTFTNTASPIYCSISEIYYDDRNPLQLLNLITPLTQSGCNFTGGGANPGNLPGGNNLSPAFQSVMQFSADASGNPSNGIDDDDDFLTMKFDLRPGASFATVADALADGTLRIGLHVRAIALIGSDSFVTDGNPPPTVPLPPAAWAGGLCLLGVGAARRLRR